MSIAQLAQLILSIHISDIPEILGNTGYLVASSYPEQLKESMNISTSRHRQRPED